MPLRRRGRQLTNRPARRKRLGDPHNRRWVGVAPGRPPCVRLGRQTTMGRLLHAERVSGICGCVPCGATGPSTGPLSQSLRWTTDCAGPQRANQPVCPAPTARAKPYSAGRARLCSARPGIAPLMFSAPLSPGANTGRDLSRRQPDRGARPPSGPRARPHGVSTLARREHRARLRRQPAFRTHNARFNPRPRGALNIRSESLVDVRS